MTVGVDGNVWFDNSFNIGRITPAGSIVEFPLPNQLTTNIARGPDGNIWFTGRINSAEIGKVTPDGKITKYPIPATANGIAAGPDGNI